MTAGEDGKPAGVNGLPWVVTPAVVAALKEHEGFRQQAYRDTQGVWTIGHGSTRYHRTGEPVREGDRVTRDQAQAELVADINEAWAALDVAPWTRRLPRPAQLGLLLASFQLGIARLLRFTRMMHALHQEQWGLAAMECILGTDPDTTSAWFQQTPARAVFVASLFQACDMEGIV